MPPLPPSTTPLPQNPRVILYFQTYHHHGTNYVSLLPLITHQTGLTHLILSAIHVNWDPNNLTLNDVPPSDPRYTQLWDEVVVLQDSGIKVMGMLGGAAKGTFARLDYSESRTDIPYARFEAYYAPLHDMIRDHNLDGLDLDVEEEMSLPGIVHLIDRLKSDFGAGFIVTLAPVATALIPGRPHLSGFDYRMLEAVRGSSIAWYNTQFYNGWGSALQPLVYEQIIANGWRPHKVVLGMLTNPLHGGSGYVPLPLVTATLGYLTERFPDFGGVMGWEYYLALPVQWQPWMWPFTMSMAMGMKRVKDAAVVVAVGRSMAAVNVQRT